MKLLGKSVSRFFLKVLLPCSNILSLWQRSDKNVDSIYLSQALGAEKRINTPSWASGLQKRWIIFVHWDDDGKNRESSCVGVIHVSFFPTSKKMIWVERRKMLFLTEVDEDFSLHWSLMLFSIVTVRISVTLRGEDYLLLWLKASQNYYCFIIFRITFRIEKYREEKIKKPNFDYLSRTLKRKSWFWCCYSANI